LGSRQRNGEKVKCIPGPAQKGDLDTVSCAPQLLGHRQTHREEKPLLRVQKR
jgi:hypothetical protein